MQRTGRGAEKEFATLIQKLPRLRKPGIILPMLQRGVDFKLTLQRMLQ